MRKLITRHGELELNWEADLWEDLVISIISQQLSDKAATTISTRFRKLFGKKFPTPEQVLKIQDEKIRECGLSWSKVAYVKNIAKAMFEGDLIMEKLMKMTDEEAVQELTKIKGIGMWTAEMTLMFTLQRPDVFSFGDVGLRTAIAKNYKVGREDTAGMEKIAEKWRPYRALAARYLWKSLE